MSFAKKMLEEAPVGPNAAVGVVQDFRCLVAQEEKRRMAAEDQLQLPLLGREWCWGSVSKQIALANYHCWVRGIKQVIRNGCCHKSLY